MTDIDKLLVQAQRDSAKARRYARLSICFAVLAILFSLLDIAVKQGWFR